MMRWVPGTELEPMAVGPIDPEKMKILAAILRDPNPIHLDRGEVRRRDLGDRLINQGPLNLGYVATMLAHNAGGHDRIRRMTARFTANVREGDRATAGGRITEVTDGAEGREARCDVWLDLEDGTRAVEGRAVFSIDPESDHEEPT